MRRRWAFHHRDGHRLRSRRQVLLYDAIVFPGGGTNSRVQGESAPDSNDAPWDSPEHLLQYDVVLRARGGAEYNARDVINGGNKTNVRLRDYLSFDTPVGVPAEQQCGRGVISDIHVGVGNDSAVPSGCGSAPLTAQEKALLFLLMDLSSCVQDDNAVPEPPN